MRKTLLALAALLALAGPAWAKVTTWTAATDTNFAEAGNWTDGPAVDGDTINLSSGTAPTSNRPSSGTYHFNITNPVNAVIGDWLDGATVGNVTADHAAASLVVNTAIGGSLTVAKGGLQLNDGADVAGAVSVGVGATLGVDYSATVTLTGAVTLAGGALSLNDATVTATGGITGIGTITLAAGAALDVPGGLTLAGGIVTNPATISGVVNCACVAWFGTGNIEIGAAGTLNLGGTAAGQSVSVAPASGTVTLAGRWGCKTLALTSGTVALGAARLDAEAAWTLDAAGLTALSSAGAILTGRRAAITVANFSGMTGTLYARRWIDGGSNGAVVKTLAPHWAVGVR